MCSLFGGSAPRDNSGDVARQQAAEREAKINAGKASIDKAFNVFDPAYFQKYQQAYLDNYNPELDRQFGLAKQDVGYDLARRGVTNSTGGQKTFGDLVTTYGNQRQGIADAATGATNKLRSDIDNQKSTLYAQNSASADPSLAAISAVSSANSLGTAPQYSPLGNVFAGLINGGSAYLNGANNRLPAGYGQLLAPGASLPGSSSVRVVA